MLKLIKIPNSSYDITVENFIYNICVHEILLIHIIRDIQYF